MTDTTFFILSKVFWLLVQPENWLTIFLLLAVRAIWLNRMERTKLWVVASLLFVLAMGWLPLGQIIMRPLELRYPAAPHIDSAAGIIVLGGGEDPSIFAASGLPETNAAGDRMSTGVALAIAHPEAKLMFAGGSAHLRGTRVSGAVVARRFFLSMGIDPDRIVLEGASRNTAENAVRLHEIVGKAGAGPWVLVTSASHMQRSMASFCAAGWRDIIPYPVDYRAISGFELSWAFTENLGVLNLALKEWIGLMAYRVLGRIDDMSANEC